MSRVEPPLPVATFPLSPLSSLIPWCPARKPAWLASLGRPLVQVEAIRSLLWAAQSRLSQLITVRKRHRRPSRAGQVVMESPSFCRWDMDPTRKSFPCLLPSIRRPRGSAVSMGAAPPGPGSADRAAASAGRRCRWPHRHRRRHQGRSGSSRQFRGSLPLPDFLAYRPGRLVFLLLGSERRFPLVTTGIRPGTG